MPLIGGRREALAFKDVTEVTPTVTADNLCALHAEGIINMSLHSTGNRIEVSGPATAGLELVIGRVKGRIATSAVIDTRGRVVRVVFTRSCALCAFLSENAKLLCISKQRKHLRGIRGPSLGGGTHRDSGPPSTDPRFSDRGKTCCLSRLVC